MYNRVILAGRLARDVEVTQTNSGKDVVNNAIAVNRYGQDEADFFDFEVWGDKATNLATYKQKGDPILVEGRLKPNRWEAQDGSPRTKIVVVASNISYLPKGGDTAAVATDTEEVPF